MVVRAICGVSAMLLGFDVLRGQDTLAFDATIATQLRKSHHIEIGVNTIGAGIEYQYQVVSFVSADAILSLRQPGAGLGLTFTPVSFFFIQAAIGTVQFENAPSADGPPPFRPDYAYGWKAGFRIPIAPKRSSLYVLVGVGQLTYIEKNYQFNGGGWILSPPPEPQYREEIRMRDIVALGIGYTFE